MIKWVCEQQRKVLIFEICDDDENLSIFTFDDDEKWFQN